jgi:hypothetical protein
VRAAIAEGKTVWIVEGEKDADRAARDLASPRRATSTGPRRTAAAEVDEVPREYAEQLRGASKVIVVADNDPAGYTHAHTVADALRPTGAAVQVVKVAVDRPKADLCDHLNAGHGLHELVPSVPEVPEPFRRPKPDAPPLTCEVPQFRTCGPGRRGTARRGGSVHPTVRGGPQPGGLVAMTLWVAHAHLVECFETTPRLAFLSPNRGPGSPAHRK